MSSLLRALFNGTSKHKKLSEEWATIREPVVEGVTFYCKYLGSTLVDDPKGEASTAEAIKRIIHAAKQVARKPERVSLHVSLQGIRMSDTTTNDLLLHTSIYKISYCSADAHYDHVFAFIATNDNETCECHAFLCPKRKAAQAVTISIAQAFNLAYEYWKMAVENKQNGEIYAHEELPAEVKVSSAVVHSSSRNAHSQPNSQTSSPIPIRSDFGSSDMSTSGYQSSTQALLIDLDDSSDHAAAESSKVNQLECKTSVLSKPWDAFGDFDDISDGFSRLALRREDQAQLLPGTSPPGWVDLDLAAFTDHPPASPTGNGFWPSASSPLPSSTASSPTEPWLLGQSPPHAWEEFSRSPNTAFLHSCQSPPTHLAFLRSLRSPASVTNNPFVPCESVKDPFVPSEVVKHPFAPCETIKDPFVPCETMKDPFVLLDRGNDAFNSSHNSESPCCRVQFTSDPFTSSHPETSSATVSPSSRSINGCGSGQPVWSNDFFDSPKGSKVICS
ncbi:low density lipoprotein receptor adapter protein 1-B-like isoform X2 [Homarus americanus]|uniref:low density lipoprotein receptor adapter protein 1-B-like isoform X2 n=1 Tax=Homarus americanus TaxID=6706 RepID=UPI001C4707E0|nr:low density lipoprotein receptor adapter protein 1-B-like isoform X2 [Homarus americanus]